MRILISYEEHTSEIPIYLLAGSCQWEEGKIYAVTWSNNFSDVKNMLGVATEFRREDDGAITAEFMPNEQFLALADDIWNTSSATIWANHVKEEKHDGYRVVGTCEVKAIFFGMGVPWNSKLEE